jgi:hypothetical protein
MNDKTSNLVGYSQTVGLTLGDSTVTTATLNSGVTTINYDWNNINSGNGSILSNGSGFTSLSQAITNSNNMVKQVRAAVFTVERNEDNKVTSAKFVKEMWVEVKNGSSLDLAVAKELDKDFDPATTVVREIYSVTF